MVRKIRLPCYTCKQVRTWDQVCCIPGIGDGRIKTTKSFTPFIYKCRNLEFYLDLCRLYTGQQLGSCTGKIYHDYRKVQHNRNIGYYCCNHIISPYKKNQKQKNCLIHQDSHKNFSKMNYCDCPLKLSARQTIECRLIHKIVDYKTSYCTIGIHINYMRKT